MEVAEVTKDYAIVDGEKIYVDAPFEEEPDKADFETWLYWLEGLLEDLFRSRNADEAVHAS